MVSKDLKAFLKEKKKSASSNQQTYLNNDQQLSPAMKRVADPKLLTNNVKFEVVVVRYTEDLHWINTKFPNDRVVVYNKGNDDLSYLGKNVEIIKLPNIGYLGGTYLYHIVTNYHKLAGRILFLQGDPFTEPGNPYKDFNDYKTLSPTSCINIVAKDCITSNIDNQWDHLRNLDWANTKYNKFVLGSSNMVRFNNEHIGEYPITEPLKINYGALFAVDRDKILLNDIDVYYNMMHFFNIQFPMEDHFFERLIDPLFGGYNSKEFKKVVSYSDYPNPVFSNEGINDIALIMMVKNEEDIILENLGWHFALGFRNFVIVDNLSTDKTREKINHFKAVSNGKAKVFVIEDPIEEYIQGKIMTGAFRFAQEVFHPRFIFPADADEFWAPLRPLKDIINAIPESVSFLEADVSRQYFDFSNADEQWFCKKLTNNKIQINHKKVLVRAAADIEIEQGQHAVKSITDRDLKGLNSVLFDLRLHEFHIRSPQQAHNKFYNGAKANIAAQKKGLICDSCGSHWNEYLNLFEQYGEQAAVIKYNEFVFTNDSVYSSPQILIGDALDLFYKISTTG